MCHKESMTTEQDEATLTLLRALHDAKCAECDGRVTEEYPPDLDHMYSYSEQCESCVDCPGLDPRCEMFRVKCEWGKGAGEKCCTRPLTLEEAKLVAWDVLDELLSDEYKISFDKFGTLGSGGIECCVDTPYEIGRPGELHTGSGLNTLDAVLAAYAATVGVEVTAA